MPMITDRDIAMLHSIGIARVLTTVELEWLHFPGWEQRSGGKPVKHATTSRLRTRIANLAKARYVQPIARVADRARIAIVRLPNLYMLTRDGADLVAENTGVERETLWYDTGHARSVDRIHHAAQIGRCYAALRAAVERDGHQLSDWQGDHQLAKSYDRIVAGGYREKLPMLPDATFVLHTPGSLRRFFVEIDRGTMPLDAWRAKAAAVEAYRGSAALRERYGVDTFFHMVVAPTETRLKRIAETVLRVRREPDYFYLFATADALEPRGVRGAWRRISAATWTTRRIKDGLSQDPHPTFSTVGLWHSPATTPATTP